MLVRCGVWFDKLIMTSARGLWRVKGGVSGSGGSRGKMIANDSWRLDFSFSA